MSGAAADQLALRQHEVVTPEGLPLRFAVAAAGDRLGALLIDQVVVILAALALAIPVFWAWAAGAVEGDLCSASIILGIYLVRNAYFPGFELAWQGRTPGKRVLKLRVIDRRGGPLRPAAVIARNLTRELEIFLPLSALFAAGQLWPGAPGLARLAAVGWLLVFGLLPLFNRDRLRVGDLLAGTLVVVQPEPVLLPDLTAAPRGALAFTTAQLDAYGVYELQVLEDVLRRGGQGRPEVLAAVAGRIRARIGWDGREPDEVFLQAYYAGLRGRLEARLLLGKRRADKHDVGR